MDCSKTIDFFSELRRLCDSRATCEATARDKQCPLYDFCELAHSRVCANDAIMAMEALQKLSNERSQKTYIQDFLEKFPKAQIDSDGTPFACRKKLYGGVRPNDKRCDRREACKNCWNEPMEE